MDDQVVLVDTNDNECGTMGKHDAHLKGKLHRAFSIVIVNKKKYQMLLQKRALGKYHSPGLWTNACCSHPMPGEDLLVAAKRRLAEEMGFVCELNKIFDFIYKVKLESPYTEYEYDHVFLGEYAHDPDPDPYEAADWKWMDIAVLSEQIKHDSQRYTFWFKLIIEKMIQNSII
ncbi:MAG: isopentenyl-diphosphate Delta-isomerase [Pseudomonadota bacterium]